MAALLILILRTTSAQSPTPQMPPPTSTIRVSTRLVTVDVVAQDKKGQPVQGLTKDDFELWEDGEQQRISVFSVEGSPTPPGPVEGSPAPTVPGAAPPATLPPQTVSNRPASPPDAPATATVILLDGLNTNSYNLAMADNQVAQFFRRLGPQDRVALYSMGAYLRVLQDFTNDPALLLNALKEMNPPKGVAQLAPPALSVPAGEFVFQGVTGPGTLLSTQPGWDPSQGIAALQRPRMTMSMFSAIGEHLAKIPGRKTLIWMSYGFPLIVDVCPAPRAPCNKVDLTPDVRSISRRLSNYHVALYPIDARGLVVGEYGGGSQPIALSLSGPVKAMLNAHDASVLLADLTGGRAVNNDNDFALAIRSAIDDAHLTYLLGYYPAADKWDSQFHTFKVRVNRPGVKLLYRTGYIAIDPQNQPPDERQRRLDSALQSPLDSTAIGFRAQLQKSGASGTPQLTLSLIVDITDLQMKQDNHHWTGGVEIVIAQRGPEGNVASENTRKHSVTLNLKEDSYTQLQKKGLLVSFPVTLDPHSVQLKVLVRDTNSGAIGSVSIPLDKTVGG